MLIKNSFLALTFLSPASFTALSALPSYALDEAEPASAPASATESPIDVTADDTAPLADAKLNQTFFKKKYRIKGSWSLIQREGKNFITFSEDFKTKNGPDLKIFLSPKSADEVTGKNAVDGSLNLGVLIKNKGPQEYEVPEGTDLSQFSTVLVHCEAYEVLWGGGAL